MYEDQPLVILTKLQKYANDLLPAKRDLVHLLVFNFSNLLLRTMLYPSSMDSYLMYRHMHAYQTDSLISNCSSLMSFNDWLPYVEALKYVPEY